MIRIFDRVSCRLAVAAALCAALALSACGRKGALDAPPGAPAGQASVAGEQAEERGTVLGKSSARGLPVVQGPDKRIPLDVLLD